MWRVWRKNEPEPVPVPEPAVWRNEIRFPIRDTYHLYYVPLANIG